MASHLLERSVRTRPVARPAAAGQHAAPRPAARRLAAGAWRLVRGLVRGLLNLALVACLVVFLALAVGPHVFGYRTMTMLTGSMEPVISPGDVVVAFPKPTTELEVGDVISYQIPVEDHRVETHRVTKVIERPDGTIAIRTKGDANEGVDPWTAVVEDDTVHVTRYVVPELGHAIRAMRHPWVQDYALWVAVGGLILVGLRRIWSSGEPAEAVEAVEAAPVVELVPQPREEGALDVPTLRRLADDVEDEEFVADFASRYQELLPTRLDRIQQALQSDDLDRALDATLSLKVASSTVGTRELADLADDLEQELRDEDLAAALATAAALPTLAERADAALAAYLDLKRSV